MRGVTWGAVPLLLSTSCARFGYGFGAGQDAPPPDVPVCTDCDAGPPACGVCDAGAPPSCSDGLQNQNETAVDCGGTCSACDAGSSPGCSDGLQNQNETAVDCGGVCAPCDAGSPATCSDGLQNQSETAIDCGGVCAPCDAGSPATCSDGLQNQNETAVDCGGVCAPCIPTSCSQVVADSVADFSGTQGQAGWFYGYYEEPNFLSANFIRFSDFRFDAGVNDTGWFSTSQTWTWIGRLRMHPNGRSTSGSSRAVDQYAVRRWVSTTSEVLFVQGTIRSTNSVSSGIRGSVLVGDREIWQQIVPARQNTPFTFQVLADVQTGDAVNLVLDPFQSTDAADDTEFSVQLCR